MAGVDTSAASAGRKASLKEIVTFIERLQSPRGARTLCLGECQGITRGELSSELQRKGHEVTYLDGADFDGVQSEHPGVGDSLGQNVFDLVITTGVIERLTWRRWSLRKLFYTIKPGGYLIVTVPNKARLSQFLPRAWRGQPTPCAYLPWQFRQLLREIGFEIISNTTYGFGVVSHHVRLFGCGDGQLVVAMKPYERPAVEEFPVFFDLCRRLTPEKEAFRRLAAWRRQFPGEAGRVMTEATAQCIIGSRPLVLIPHPDDEIIGCGGLLLRLTRQGVTVSLLYLTDGGNTAALRHADEATRQTIRLEEAKRVADALSPAQAFFWRARTLDCTDENVNDLSDLLIKIQPTSIFVPFFTDMHREHCLASELLRRAWIKSRLDTWQVFVFGYEVWSVVPANCYFDIKDEFDRKADLLWMYTTGMKAADYITRCETMNAYHALSGLQRRSFAEAFTVLPINCYLDLLQRTQHSNTLLGRAKSS